MSSCYNYEVGHDTAGNPIMWNINDCSIQLPVNSQKKTKKSKAIKSKSKGRAK